MDSHGPVLDAFVGHPILTSREIAYEAGLPRHTVLEILDQLLAEGRVEIVPSLPRSATLYRLTPIKT